MNKKVFITKVQQGKDKSYKVKGVCYTASSKYMPIYTQQYMQDQFKKVVSSDFIPLTALSSPNTITDEYVSSAVGKED